MNSMEKLKSWLIPGAYIYVPWRISKQITGTRDKTVHRFGYVKRINTHNKYAEIECHLFEVEGYNEEDRWLNKNLILQPRVTYNTLHGYEIVLSSKKSKFKVPFRPLTLKEGFKVFLNGTVAIHCATGRETILYPLFKVKDEKGIAYFYDPSTKGIRSSSMVMFNYVNENYEPFGIHI